jgi:hypothetical protein
MSVVWHDLPEYVLSDRPAREIIDQVIDTYETQLSHEAWQRLRALDWDDGVTVVADWLRAVLQREPPPEAVRGLWFGLDNPVDSNGRVRSDLYVSGTSEYDPDDDALDWVFSGCYLPDGQPAPACLTDMYRIAYEHGDGLGNDAEWPLALVFGCVAVTRALQALDRSAGGWSPGAPAGVVCGFEGGDFIFLGELHPVGFHACPRLP